jgi:hypothetical protein
MPSTPGVINYPATLDDVLSLIEVKNNASDTLTGNISVSDLLIPVATPGKFPNSGFVTLVDSLTTPTKIEVVIYSGKSGSNLVVPVGGRGAQGSTAFAFSTGNFVEQRPTARHHTVLADAIMTLQAKLGIGADTPGAAVEALFSSGAGASLWRAIVAGDLPNLPISQITALQAALDGKQPLDSDLTTIAAIASDGFMRRIGGVWQTSTPLTRFSVTGGFILDPSVNPPFADATQLPVWVAPTGLSGGFLSRFGVIYFAGSHNPGSAISFALVQNAASIATIILNDTNNSGFTAYVNDFADVPIAGGNAVWIVCNGRSGTIGERSVSLWFEGYQNAV